MKQLNGSMILKIGKIQKDLDDLREKAAEADQEISQLGKMESCSKTITERRK